jgi:hypothetical protein
VADDIEFRKIELYARSRLDNAYALDCVDRKCPRAVVEATSLALRGKTLSEVPTWLHSCANLRYLAIPKVLASCLSPDVLPDGLTTLELTGEGKARIDGFVHEAIQRVVAPNIEVRFLPSAFPGLKHFHAKSDRKRSVLRELQSSGVELISATVSPFSSSADLRLLIGTRLAYLRLVGGNGTSLEGISRFSSLTDLHLHNLPRLESIEELTRLPLLSDISVGYCKRIRDVATMADMKSLRRLFFYGCDELLTAADRELLEGMQLELLTL